MTFELSPEQVALRDRARQFAASLHPRAADIDRAAAIPPDVIRDAGALCGSDPFGFALTIEALATASAAVAIAAAARANDAGVFALSGLRGATALDHSPRSQLALAAAALGIAKAALDVALGEVRRSTAVPGAEIEKPHWVVADAATEVEAARLLVYKAARTAAEADIAVGRLMAAAAATRAVDTALRVAGADALREGSELERLSRDVRAVALVLGTEEQQRAVAADGLFPR